MAKKLFLQIDNLKDVELESYRVVSSPQQNWKTFYPGKNRLPETIPAGYTQNYNEIEAVFRTRPDLFNFLNSPSGLKEFRVTIKEMEVLRSPPRSRVSRTDAFFCTLLKFVTLAGGQTLRVTLMKEMDAANPK